VVLVTSDRGWFEIYSDLAAKPFPKFQKWSVLNMEEDHRDRQPNQPPSKWTNITLTIPWNSYAIQLTSNTTYIVTEEIEYVGLDLLNEIIYISVAWWGKPWKLYIGWEQ